MAEIKDILEANDFSVRLDSESNLGTTLSRTEIEGTLAQHGYNLPLENSVGFFIKDRRDHVFQIFYSKDLDMYTYIKLKHAN